MVWASIFYLGGTLLLFLVFGAIVLRTCRDKEKGEEPKYRMMDE